MPKTIDMPTYSLNTLHTINLLDLQKKKKRKKKFVKEKKFVISHTLLSLKFIVLK